MHSSETKKELGLDRYAPENFEPKWIERWEKDHLANPDFVKNPQGEKVGVFSMVIPPPNVTGTLHIGHALVNTLQDILARWQRMKGKKVLWLPGTDHAGIATQMVVENFLRSKGIKRTEIGREAFIKEVWSWKEQYGGKIKDQLKRMGFSLDFSRERFTLDAGLSLAVKQAFKFFFDQGWIKKGYRLVNWCLVDDTALSDLEVEYKEVDGNLYEIAYPIENSSERIIVATSRPETLLGDVAIAVHPEDERYQKWIGKNAILPLVGRKLKIIADAYVEKTFGTGVLKITPGHDFQDFALAKKYALPVLDVFDKKKLVINSTYPTFQGLTFSQARPKILEALQAQGFLVKSSTYKHKVGFSQRQKSVVEPRLSEQWFFDVKNLAKEVIKAMDAGDFQVVPPNQATILRNWLENIEDWCISRQLWWGHPIPAYFCSSCQAYFSSLDEQLQSCEKCGQKIMWEEDVLDTWFSSGLFPFSTMGWPNTQAKDYQLFYPNSTLITAYDILFFWVARMAMMGLALTKKLPFPQIYAHGLIRDEQGRKMSKTTGNGIDPLDVIKKHGADALRFELCSKTSMGRDLKIGDTGIAQSKIFLNKLFNAAKFLLYQKEKFINHGKVENQPSFQELFWQEKKKILAGKKDFQQPYSPWFFKQLQAKTAAAEVNLEKYRFHDYCQEIYQLLYHLYCDQFLEIAKPLLQPSSLLDLRLEILATLDLGLDQILRLMHPVVPFLTEELWQNLFAEGKEEILARQPFSFSLQAWQEFSVQQAEILMDLVEKIRSLRGENDISPQMEVDLRIHIAKPQTRMFVQKEEGVLKALAKLNSIAFVEKVEQTTKTEKWAYAVAEEYQFGVLLPFLAEKEENRVTKEIEKWKEKIQFLNQKLSNAEFLAKAPPQLVEKTKQELQATQEKLANMQGFSKEEKG